MVQNPQTVFASIMAKKDRSPKKQDRTALETNQTAEIAWLTNQAQEHPVVGMTPQQMYRLLTDAEQGNLQAQADLFADMEERDGHIFSEMDKRKKGINGLDWGVKPPKNASEQEKKIAEEVREWIEDIQDFEMFLFDAMDAVGHGYSCQEIEWHQVGNLWLPKSFEHQLARNFMTPFDKPNELRLNDGSPEGAEFWDFGWFIHRHKAKSGYIARSGLHRILCWPFIFKNYGIRDVMQFLEVYGLPIRLGKYPSGATDQEKMTLLRAVMSIGRNAGGIIPNGMSLDFESAADGDTKNHMSLIDWCEKTASKIIVGGTLLSQADGKTSTNAQSNTHELQFEKIIKSDAKQLARSLTDYLVSALMRLNYPNIQPDRYPSFFFDTSDTEDMQVFGESLEKLVRVGMRIPVSWPHERLGIPQPADDKEPILTIQNGPMPNLAMNTYQPQLLGGIIAANSAQLPIEEQSLQLLLKDQTNIAQDTVESWTKQLLAKIRSGNEEEILALLQDAYPADDEPALQEKLTRLIFASEVLGRLSVQAEQT
ncbi:portal protein [Acinetobacter pittii]|uniref:DUF935 domain-containing protein n=1 Tax=Acinetobacter calcoaceticus/baumannii complex TaxID=909768 RepID=UPI00029DE653|nr:MULTISPECIES: DUF935 domain-containing protein [Acinetobacter calcoaceticus/baumannii complex]AUT33918.1 DUF935 domain-containing protein [Acinetobacter pittii]EKU67599.1 PF06074 family protein [Acinetobacter pittii]EXG31139.1 hypothetical protein J733_2181 [Acinetobacter sp. 263903-2]KRJ08007.1 portal protein [Acinetobacter pittii]MBJ8469514.1 DUF935 domain-containing protein [Acinetobacter pittii]